MKIANIMTRSESAGGMVAVAEAFKPALLDAEQAAWFCGMSRAAWYKRLSAGQVPRPVKIGSLARWRKDELAAWIGVGCPPRDKWDAEMVR